MADENYEYEVAISFAAPQRPYAGKVAASLRDAGISVFFDEFEENKLWGSNLFDFFDAVYRKKSKVVLMCLSAAYGKQAWTRHERQSAQARALFEERPYILPLRFDDSEIPGILKTTRYLDARALLPGEVAHRLIQKLQAPDAQDVSEIGIGDTNLWPPAELREREPPGWEYLLFFRILSDGIRSLKKRRLDFDLQMRTLLGPPLSHEDARELLMRSLAQPGAAIESADRIMNEQLPVGLGEPGQSGDADVIEHCAESLVAVYQSMLDWSEQIRSTNVPDEYLATFQHLATMPSNAIHEFEAFATELNKGGSQITEFFAELSDEEQLADPLNLSTTLTLTVADAWSDEYSRRLKRLKKLLRRR